MLVTLQGFGSIWERRPEAALTDSSKPSRTAYYNTTGVMVKGKVHYRWRIGGKIRFNSIGGFNPNYPLRALNRVFDCEEPQPRPGGWRQILFKQVLTHPVQPDLYLLVLKAEQTGHMDIRSPFWKAPGVRVVSFSEVRAQQESIHQEIMLLMPAYSWIRGELGTFFVEPSAKRIWTAELRMGQPA